MRMCLDGHDAIMYDEDYCPMCQALDHFRAAGILLSRVFEIELDHDGEPDWDALVLIGSEPPTIRAHNADLEDRLRNSRSKARATETVYRITLDREPSDGQKPRRFIYGQAKHPIEAHARAGAFVQAKEVITYVKPICELSF